MHVHFIIIKKKPMTLLAISLYFYLILFNNAQILLLFYRYRFCQISWFIHITTFSYRYIVTKKLKWNNGQRIGKIPICLRNIDYIICCLLNLCISFSSLAEKSIFVVPNFGVCNKSNSFIDTDRQP